MKKLLFALIALIPTIIIKIITLLGILRLQFGMSEWLDDDLSFIVAATSRHLNLCWDTVFNEEYASQPHHTLFDQSFAAIVGTIQIIFLLLWSFMPWEMFKKR